MQAATPFPNARHIARQFWQSILRGGARFMLAGAMTLGIAACAPTQHVATAPVGAVADSRSGTEKRSAPSGVVRIDELIDDLKHGGYVIVFRHAPTNRDQSDSDPLNYSDITRQRRLSAAGVELATKVAYALRELGVPVGEIYTSKYDRAI